MGGGMVLKEEPTLVSLVLFYGFCWVVHVFPDGAVLHCGTFLTLKLSFFPCVSLLGTAGQGISFTCSFEKMF